MLTNQGSTQVYSPFGSYVVEQHRAPCERQERRSAPEPREERQEPARFGWDFQKAA